MQRQTGGEWIKGIYALNVELKQVKDMERIANARRFEDKVYNCNHVKFCISMIDKSVPYDSTRRIIKAVELLETYLNQDKYDSDRTKNYGSGTEHKPQDA
jgi:hypothetical protein